MGEKVTHDDLVEDITTMKGQMEVALEGVSNFRKFQLENAKQVGQIRALALVWSIIGGALLAIGSVALHAAAPIIGAILQDYYQHHPAVTERLQQHSTNEPIEARAKAPTQDAGSRISVHY